MKRSANLKADKKVLLLIFVLVLLSAAVLYRLLNPFEQQRVKQLTYTGTRPVKEKKNLVPDIKAAPSISVIEEFLNKKPVSAAVHKDLFKTWRPKSNLPVQKPDQPSKKTSQEEKEPPKPVRQDPVMKVKEYLSSYRVYGTYKSGNTKAVFLGKDKLVLVARTGDRLDGKYLIDDIQENHIRIKALDINETIHLDMREFNNE